MSLLSHRFRRLSLEGGLIMLGQAAAVLGSLALVRLFTEYLTPAEYGILALALTLPSLINQIVMAPITASVTRYFAVAKEGGEVRRYVSAVWRLLGAGSLAVVLVCAVGFTIAARSGLGEWLLVGVLALIAALVSGWVGALNGIQTAARQRAIVAFHVGLDAWLRVALGLVLLNRLDDPLTAALAAYCLSAFTVMISQLSFIRRILPDRETGQREAAHWMKQMYRFGWPFSLWGLPTWMQMSSDRWALQAFAPAQHVGAYAVLFQLGYTPISLLTSMAMTFLAPILYQRSGDATDSARNSQVRRMNWQLVAVAAGMTLILAIAAQLLHEPLFRILVAEDYRSISPLLSLVVLSGGGFAVGQVISLRLMSELRSERLVVPKVVTAVLGIAMNFGGALLYGIEGVVFALLLFSIIYVAWMLFLAAGKHGHAAATDVLQTPSTGS